MVNTVAIATFGCNLFRPERRTEVPETEEYGVKNFVYRARRPFDPVKFDQFIREPWPGVIRAKGHFWLAVAG